MKLSKEKIDVWRQILGMISQQMTHPRDLVWAHHHRDCKWVWKHSKKVLKKLLKKTVRIKQNSLRVENENLIIILYCSNVL